MKELSGKVVQVLDEISGESSRGPWRKKSFVLELPGEYPKKVCIDMWGDRIDEFDVKQGEDLKAAIDIESRGIQRKVVYKRQSLENRQGIRFPSAS